MNDPSLYNHLDDTVSSFDAMATSIQQGQGSLGKLVTSDDLYNKVDSAVGKATMCWAPCAIRRARWASWSTIPARTTASRAWRDKSNALLGDVRAGKGTLGKLATDDSLFANLRDASANVRDATAKLNSNQGTVGKLFTDPALYDNLTGLTGDMRLLVGDFRQNPKKFLHIKLGIF